MAGFTDNQVFQYYGMGPHAVRLPDGSIVPAPPPQMPSYQPSQPAQGGLASANMAPRLMGQGGGAPGGMQAPQGGLASAPPMPMGQRPQQPMSPDQLSALAMQLRDQKLQEYSAPAALSPQSFSSFTPDPGNAAAYAPGYSSHWGF